MKRMRALLVAAVLCSGVPSLAQAGGQEAPAPAIPPAVSISDPVDDANGLNDQGYGGTTGFHGDTATPADAGSVSDILDVWFTHTVADVTAHIHIQAAAPAATAIRYDVLATPGEGLARVDPTGCVGFSAIVPGAYQGEATTWQGAAAGRLLDRCNDGTNMFQNGFEASVALTTLGDGSGIVSITGPRAEIPFLVDGRKLVAPTAFTRVTAGADGVGAAYPVYIDNTELGVDYELTAPPVAEPTDPPESDKKACAKGKGRKKGTCP